MWAHILSACCRNGHVDFQVRMTRHFRKSLVTLLAGSNRVSLDGLLNQRDLRNAREDVT
jgi:hypothetical protein